MKLTFALIAALLVVVPQTSQASSLDKLLETAQDKTKSIINDAINKATSAVNDAEHKAAELGEELKQKVTEFLQKVETQVAEILEKVRSKLHDLVGDHDDPNLSECKKLAGTVIDVVMEVIANETACVSEKLNTGKSYIDSISEVATEVTDQLKKLQEEARQCTVGVNGLKSTAEAIVCINKVGLEAVWVSMKRIPEVSVDAVKLGFLVSTLPITLPQCAAKNGFNSLAANTDHLVSGVKQCVNDNLGSHKPHPEVTQAPVVTEPIVEVTKAPVVTEATTVEVTPLPEVTEATTVEVTPLPEVTEATTVEVTPLPEVTEATTVQLPEPTEEN